MSTARDALLAMLDAVLAVTAWRVIRDEDQASRERPLTFTDKIRAADPEFDRGETAYLLACRARDAADWQALAAALDVAAAEFRWTTARAARAVLMTAGHDPFSANHLRHILPRRAWHLIPGTLRALALEGLVRAGSQTERSTAPGARGWRVALYRLTPSGREAADSLRPGGSPFPDTMLRLLEEAS